jgi:hypothetical protein
MISHARQQIDRVRQARSTLERMRHRLMCPSVEAIDACAQDLSLAVECLRQLDVSAESPIWHGLTRQVVEAEVVALRQSLRSVEELLRNAGVFYAGLARLLAPDPAPANYTAVGAPLPPPEAVGGSIALQG